MNVGRHISLLLLLGLPVLSFAQQSPAKAGSSGEQESQVPPTSHSVTPFPHPAVASEMKRGPIKLDVVVTDDQGSPIAGLDVTDFTLLDNGQPTPIVSFRSVPGTPQATNPPVEVILLIDAINTPFRDVAFQRMAMEKFLRQYGGHLAMPVSIFMLTNDGVMAQPKPSADGNAQAEELIKIDSGLRKIRPSTGGYGLAQLFQESIRGLTDITLAEREKPGKKLLIWASSGWLMFEHLEFSSQMQQQYFDTIVNLSTSLREARISLYCLQGSAPSQFADRYYKNFLKGVRTREKAGPDNLSVGVLAEQSGGRVLEADNDLTARINRCVADAAAFYTISFDPPRAAKANEYHELKVRIRNPKLTARTSAGYYNQP